MRYTKNIIPQILFFSYDYITSTRSNAATMSEPHYEISDQSTRIADGHRATTTTTNQSGLSPIPRYETNESFVASATPSSQHYAVSYATPGITQSRNFMEVNVTRLCTCMCLVFVIANNIIVEDSKIFWQFNINIWQVANLASTVQGSSTNLVAKFVFSSLHDSIWHCEIILILSYPLSLPPSLPPSRLATSVLHQERPSTVSQQKTRPLSMLNSNISKSD